MIAEGTLPDLTTAMLCYMTADTLAANDDDDDRHDGANYQL